MAKDVIVVLGGGINQDGSLPLQAKYRVKKAVELYKKKIAPRMILSGKYSIFSKRLPPLTEAEAMKRYALSLGVNQKDVFIESESQDTISNAYLTKIQFLEPYSLKDIVVVTSDFHIKRTRYIFKKVLGQGYKITIVPAENKLSSQQLKEAQKSEQEKLLFTKQWFKTAHDFLEFETK